VYSRLEKHLTNAALTLSAWNADGHTKLTWPRHLLCAVILQPVQPYVPSLSALSSQIEQIDEVSWACHCKQWPSTQIVSPEDVTGCMTIFGMMVDAASVLTA